MNKLLMAVLGFCFFLIACNETNRKINNETVETDIDAARKFIQAALEGRYDIAETILLIDSDNVENFKTIKRFYNDKMSEEDKEGYRQATILIYETKKLNDSTSVFIYSNSYKNQRDSLKVVRVNNNWLVDFKYIFQKPIPIVK